MRNVWLILAAVAFVGGFIIPAIWLAVPIAIVFAIGSAPPGTRADGRARSGGLLGGALDAIEESGTAGRIIGPIVMVVAIVFVVWALGI